MRFDAGSLPLVGRAGLVLGVALALAGAVPAQDSDDDGVPNEVVGCDDRYRPGFS